ncbi:hypothetical protein [Methanoplanus endosymbiosus]|uniref:Uncharacterized protein n=1 Tax=Methanoplanus endosymbiosus TaxID=33865 RepID=A0A9E7PN03_9EURY|nr:hypothetical protein [Methanoplanus endosymbiosus]UUX93233.1 hypothetical protein L6E24_03670 [Methanoplanus endosymbiosus]
MVDEKQISSLEARLQKIENRIFGLVEKFRPAHYDEYQNLHAKGEFFPEMNDIFLACEGMTIESLQVMDRQSQTCMFNELSLISEIEEITTCAVTVKNPDGTQTIYPGRIEFIRHVDPEDGEYEHRWFTVDLANTLTPKQKGMNASDITSKAVKTMSSE